MRLIRNAQPEDARGIAEVHVQSWIAAYAGLLPAEKVAQLNVDQREHTWRERLASPGALELRGWVAVQKDQIVGFAFTQPSKDEDLSNDIHELSALYLLPSVWGMGIGTVFLATAESALRVADVQEASLWVLEDNVRATTFYESRGWRVEKRDSSFRDFGAAAWRYRKHL